MSNWKDSQGRSWSMAVTISTVKRTRDLAGINLLDVFDGKLLSQLSQDPELLVNTIYAVCKPQADAAGVSDEQFGELLVGDAIEQAAEALVQGIIDFFPRDRRPVLNRLWAKTKSVNEATLELMGTKIDSEQVDQLVAATLASASREFDQRVQRELAKLADGSPEPELCSSPGSWPESSASTPAP